MSPLRRRMWTTLALIGLCTQVAAASDAPKPLSDSELMALVAGNSLSETIVQEISTRGLGFRADDRYRSLLAEAGADPRLLRAVAEAKVMGDSAGTKQESANMELDHLAAAGKLLRTEEYAEATAELTDALQEGAEAEAGFVMCEVLLRQQNWGEAGAIMERIQSEFPNFPETDTKLSYLLYRAGDGEAALAQAKAALTVNPNNAEAHKNAGLALQILQKYKASEQEYREALRLKTDYAFARFDLGLLFYAQKKYDQAISEYKKAIVLDSANSDIRYDLGAAYEGKGDLDSAIREYREAKKLNPEAFGPREALGQALEARGINADAVKEFREMEAKWPNESICHNCLATALYATGQIEAAEKEFRITISIDPTDIGAHDGLGSIRQYQKDYDGALNEYRKAEELAGDLAEPYVGAGTALLSKKDFAGAEKELKRAEDLTPSDANIHELRGQALAALGDSTNSIKEFKEAVTLDPKRFSVRVELASSLEARGDWADSLEEYRLAAESSIPQPGTVVAVTSMRYPGPQAAYQAAQERFHQRVASLKAAGKTAEAMALEASIRQPQATRGLSEQLDAAILKGNQAAAAGRFEEIEKDYTAAVALAEKVQPRDDRLMFSVLHLANFYAGRKEFELAETNFQKSIKVAEELHGQGSPELTHPLQELGHYYLTRHDYTNGFDYYSRAVAINEKAYGENSNVVADCLRELSFVYLAQKDYAKAEPILLQAQGIVDSLVGPDGDGEDLVLWTLCNLYKNWGRPEKAEPRYRQLLAIQEKQFGPQSPLLVPALNDEAHFLRELGRAGEAAQFEKRAESIRSANGQGGAVQPTPASK